MSKKKGIKKGSAQAKAYAEQQTARKQAWTRNVYEYTQQETLDAASLVLHDLFGFGPERLKRFGDAFIAKFHEIQELSREDGDDPDRVYSRERFETAMQEAWGPHYAPRYERYAGMVVDRNGHPVIDQ